jgi:shikimate kinase
VKAVRDIRNVALIGFMGTGKSTVGRLTAEWLGFDFVDTDMLVEAKARKSIAALFAEEGEAVFRGYEREVVTELAQRRATVIATGGGLGANPDNLASLRQHALIVCLWAPAEVILERVRHLERRPLLQVPDPLGRIRDLLAQRTPVYQQADVPLTTASRQSGEVVRQVVHHFRLAAGLAS